MPLEMRGPGIPQGVTIDRLVINADLAPTIVDGRRTSSPASTWTAARCSR